MSRTRSVRAPQTSRKHIGESSEYFPLSGRAGQSVVKSRIENEVFPRSVADCPKMYASLADRSSRQLVKRLARLDILCIDELGYLNLKPEQTNIFFKLMEERYRCHSTIITTNLMYDEWPNFLGNRPMAEALLRRLRHFCHTVHIQGPPLPIHKGEAPRHSGGGAFKRSALRPPFTN